ncbi:MAG: HDOD domain-containing protein [Rubrivivax sp.]|nr:HDOD domain-containing protein [Rubrivivax sp.]
MTVEAATPPDSATRIEREIDRARRDGPLRQIVVPPCPELLTRLQRAMAVREPDLDEVARIANADVAMAATLIRNANSALAAVGPPVSTAGQAMNRLGLRQSAAIMTGFLACHAIPVKHPQLQGFWERSTRRAQAMALIAADVPGLPADLAYSYGLFNHVGLPVLLQSVKGYASTLVEAAARKDRSPVATENANHRTDHAVVGALTARAWRLSPLVVAAIRLHHDLGSLGSAQVEADVHTLVAAGLVAEALVVRHEGLATDADWAAHGQAALDWLQVGSDDMPHWQDRLADVAG